MNGEVVRAAAELGLSTTPKPEIVDALPLLRELLPSLVARFYEHLVATDQTHRLEGAEVARLLPAMVAHWSGLFANGLDDAYVGRVMRIGIAHRERRILPDLYLRGYGRFTADLVAETMRRAAVRPARRAGRRDPRAALLRHRHGDPRLRRQPDRLRGRRGAPGPRSSAFAPCPQPAGRGGRGPREAPSPSSFLTL